MKLNRHYSRVLAKLAVIHAANFVKPVRCFLTRLSINQVRAWLARLEREMEFHGDSSASDDEEPTKGPRAWINQCWRCPHHDFDLASLAWHLGQDVEAIEESPIVDTACLYKLLVSWLAMREQAEFKRRASLTPAPLRPLIIRKRRRIPSPRPVSPFIYV